MLKGFTSEGDDSQIIFRQVLAAMANPGTITDINIDLCTPKSLDPAAGAILLALLDFETPLWSDLDNNSEDIQWLKFHTGAPYTYIKNNALFGLCHEYDTLELPDTFNCGDIESPHESTTLIIQTRGINKKKNLCLTGPGIKNQTFLELKGIKQSFFNKRAEIFKDYPLGIDMIFVCATSFVAIPRTTKLEIL